MRNSPRSGVKEVVIPPLEIVSEVDARTAIVDLLRQNKELAVYQICIVLKRSENTIRRICNMLCAEGILQRRYVIAKLDGRGRQVALYRLCKSSL